MLYKDVEDGLPNKPNKWVNHSFQSYFCHLCIVWKSSRHSVMFTFINRVLGPYYELWTKFFHLPDLQSKRKACEPKIKNGKTGIRDTLYGREYEVGKTFITFLRCVWWVRKRFQHAELPRFPSAWKLTSWRFFKNPCHNPFPPSPSFAISIPNGF